MILGLSAGTLAEFAAVPPGVVDYLGVGPVFATGTKPDHDPPLGIAGWPRWSASRRCPRRHRRSRPLQRRRLRATGVDGIAVVSAICAARTPKRRRALARPA